jgi:hypothetical protein
MYGSQIRFGAHLTPIIDPWRVGPGPSRTNFGGFVLRWGRFRRSCAEFGQDFCLPPPNFGGGFALVLAPRLQGMEPRRWLAAAVLMCLLVHCCGRGRLLALLCSLLVSPHKRKRKNSVLDSFLEGQIPSWISFSLTIERRTVQTDSGCRLIFLGLLGECGRSVMC